MIEMAVLFPNGIQQYLLGGLFIGLGVSVIYLSTALIPGASTFLESTLSYASSIDRFQEYRASRDWRMVFTLGIVGGSTVYAMIFQDGVWTTEVSIWKLFLGGVLVGMGTRIGKGCTSGHGVCGTASFSKTSIISVAVFLSVAIATAMIVPGGVVI